jgi:hypothetical protein
MVATLTKNSFSSKKKLQPQPSWSQSNSSSELVRFWEALKKILSIRVRSQRYLFPLMFIQMLNQAEQHF